MTKQVKALCSLCKRETNHEILHQEDRSYSNEDIWGDETWQLIECRGCEEISFRYVWTSSEDYDFETGQSIPQVSLYPLRNQDTLSMKTISELPSKVRSIYFETIEAYNNDLNILCAGGLRATIEAICINKGISSGPVEISPGNKKIRKNLEGKINGLYENGFLTKLHAEILNGHRFIGNEALHKLEKPSKVELKLAIDIIEHTLENIYELSEKAFELDYEKKRRIKLLGKRE